MSFFDSYKEISGTYLNAADKQVLIDNGISFSIVALTCDDENRFGPRWIASCLVPDPENGEEAEKLLACPIGTVESRDRMLSAMDTYLATEDAEPVRVKLETVGRSILIRPAA